MKKTVLLIIGLYILFAFKTDQPKLFKVEADLNQWNQIINIIDLSVADPKERVAAKNFIADQLNKQLKSQLPKPPIDSSNKIK